MTRQHTPVAHGYTMRDLDHLARTAVATAHVQILDAVDRYDAAWHAIAEALCDAETPPAARELTLTGAYAINRYVQDHRRAWGLSRAPDEDGVVHNRLAFERYWALSRRGGSSPEDIVVDGTALTQIWSRLSSTHQSVLVAMATHDDPVRAADSVGKSLVCFRSHLKNARRAVLVLWHEHETPSRLWSKGTGRRSGTRMLRNRRQQRARRAAA